MAESKTAPPTASDANVHPALTHIDALKQAEPFKTSGIFANVNDWLRYITTKLPGKEIPSFSVRPSEEATEKILVDDMDNGEELYKDIRSWWLKFESLKNYQLDSGADSSFAAALRVAIQNLGSTWEEQGKINEMVTASEGSFLSGVSFQNNQIKIFVSGMDDFLKPHNEECRTEHQLADGMATIILQELDRFVKEVDSCLEEIQEGAERTGEEINGAIGILGRNLKTAVEYKAKAHGPEGTITVDPEQQASFDSLSKSALFQQALKEIKERGTSVTINFSEAGNLASGGEQCLVPTTNDRNVPCRLAAVTANGSPRTIAHEMAHAWFGDDDPAKIMANARTKDRYIQEMKRREWKAEFVGKCICLQAGDDDNAEDGDYGTNMENLCNDYLNGRKTLDALTRKVPTWMPQDWNDFYTKHYGDEWDEVHPKQPAGTGATH